MNQFFKQEYRMCQKHGDVLHTDIFGTFYCNFCSHERSIKDVQVNHIYDKQRFFLNSLSNANLSDSVPVKQWQVYSHDLHHEQTLNALQKWLVHSLTCKNVKNLILKGSVGTGKTYCAKSLARAWVGMGYSAYFCSSKSIVNRHKERFSGSEIGLYKSFIHKIENVDLFVLDDMGNGDGDNEIIKEILEVRHSNKKPTIITTNYMDNDIHPYFGDRVVDRFYENCLDLTFDWESYRKLNQERNNQQSFIEDYY